MPSKSVIYLQPIFAPTEHLKNKNIDSLKSLIAYFEKYGVTFDVALEGWAQEDKYWDEIVSVAAALHPVHIVRREHNDGKAVTVNSMYDTVVATSEYSYILTADSDMIFVDTVDDMIERLIKISKYMTDYNKKKTGIVGLNQLVNTRHYTTVYKNVVHMMRFNESKETVVWPDTPFGIAGGALFIPVEAWKAVGGYRKMGVYAGDDAYIIQDMHAKGYGYYMAKDIAMLHPHDNDEDYRKWKDYTLGFFNKGNVVGEEEFEKIRGTIERYFEDKNSKEKLTSVDIGLDKE
jgi:hypothetical protein